MKLEYTSEETFLTEEIEFSDEHYELAKNLYNKFKNEFNSSCYPLIVKSDKKSLCFGINLGDREKDRVGYEGKNLYRITIEKI